MGKGEQKKAEMSENMALGITVAISMAFSGLSIATLVIFLALRSKGGSMFPMYDDHIKVDAELSSFRKKFANVKTITEPTIFIAISSYRDPELCITIEDIFKKAAHPERLYVGIVEQNSENDPLTCHARNARVDQGRLNIQTLSYRDAKGPTYARHLCEKLYGGQEWYLMCDSHMRFEPGWDSQLLEMIYKTRRPKRTVITWYAEGITCKMISNGKQVMRGYLTRKRTK